MFRHTAIGLATVALLCATGCAPRMTVSLPLEGNGAPTGSEGVVTPGQKARITLVSGKKYEGTVLRANSDELVVGRPGNYGQEELVFSASEISSIEVAAKSGADDHATILVPAATVIISILAVAMYNSWNNWY